MIQETLQQIAGKAQEAITSAANADALEVVRVEYLGRNGALAGLSKEMKNLKPEEKASVGKLLNQVKNSLEQEFDARKAAFDKVALDARLEAEWIDLTLPAAGTRPGSIHPCTQVQQEIEDLFVSLGFTVLDGPEVETEYNNFDALNIPADHPALAKCAFSASGPR